MGDSDLERMKMGNMDSSGRDLTKAGRILGIIGTVYLFIMAIMAILFFAGVLWSRPSP